jgi:hypothetical protein
MKLTCPSCGAEYPIEAGLLEDDGKRLGALLADLEPALARAVLSYLRLFKPVKTALRTVRAIKLLQELLGLIRTGTVCRDERGGIQRPATPAMWIAGIEQMLQQIGGLDLPLGSHGYLRKVVYGLADAADAVAERRRHDEARKRPRTGNDEAASSPISLDGKLATLKLRRELGKISQADYERAVEAAQRVDAANGGGRQGGFNGEERDA